MIKFPIIKIIINNTILYSHFIFLVLVGVGRITNKQYICGLPLQKGWETLSYMLTIYSRPN